MRKPVQNRIVQKGRTKMNQDINKLGVVEWLKSRKIDVFLVGNDENTIIDDKFIEEIYEELRKNKKKELDKKGV